MTEENRNRNGISPEDLSDAAFDFVQETSSAGVEGFILTKEEIDHEISERGLTGEKRGIFRLLIQIGVINKESGNLEK